MHKHSAQDRLHACVRNCNLSQYACRGEMDTARRHAQPGEINLRASYHEGMLTQALPASALHHKCPMLQSHPGNFLSRSRENCSSFSNLPCAHCPAVDIRFSFHSPAGPPMTCFMALRQTLAGVSHRAAPARKPLSALPLHRTSEELKNPSNSSWFTQTTSMTIRRGFADNTASLQHTAAVQQEEAAAASATVAVLVPVADGSEEIEAVTIIDTLRRAGAEVTVASVERDPEVTCSRGVRLVADGLISEYKEVMFDAISLPGGMPGAERLRDSEALQAMLVAHTDSGRLITAICAAPAVVLEARGFLDGRRATAHPAFVAQLSDQGEAEARVVVDGPFITSRGPGTALEFSLALVKALFGRDKASDVAGPMVLADGLKY